jgi:glucose/arabinose dehydrogenase
MSNSGSSNGMQSIGWLTALLCLSACGGGSGDRFVPPPPVGGTSIATERVFSQLVFTQPLAMVQVPGDNTRWYVVERSGIIRVFDNDPNVMQSTVFANLTGIVDDTANESGLLGLAFHPDFASNGEVYVSYTAFSGGLISRVSRFVSQDGGLTLNTGSEQVLLSIAQPATNHNGGQIAFGADGYLYAGWGDGGGAGDPQNNAQNTTNLFGAITRIDVDSVVAPYGIPGDNPFAGNPLCSQGVGVADCPEIFAWGFRNPWRWSFDSLNGNLWVGDVGQGDWEEIDHVEISMNYGWNIREGANCYPPGTTNCATNFVDPITEYSHSLGNSVTGGYVYRGMDIANLQGMYVYGDFGSGRIWSVPANSMQGAVGDELLDTGYSIASFAEDMDGELYLFDYGVGAIYKIVAAP